MALRLFRKFKKNPVEVIPILDEIYEDRTFPELNVSPTSSGQYVSGYDENGNRTYTWDRKLSMGYSDELPEGLVEKRRKRWSFKRKRGNGTTYPGLHGDAATLAKAAELGIGTAMLSTNPVTGKMAGNMLADLYYHPVLNSMGFFTSSIGSYYDRSFGWTENLNLHLPNNKQLPDISIGATLGYPLGYNWGYTFVDLPINSFLGRALSDVTLRPVGTIRALFNGRYLYNKDSIRRNLLRLLKANSKGFESTNLLYKDIGVEIPLEETKISSQITNFRKLDPFTVGYFSPVKNKIYTPLLSSKQSNIAMSSRNASRIAGHEQAHAIEKFLKHFSPSLDEFSSKTGYYVVNPSHPVASKYKKWFNFGNRHGKTPEETWANYMGAKAAKDSKLRYFFENLFNERLPPNYKFINDYKLYLKTTYGNIGM